MAIVTFPGSSPGKNKSFQGATFSQNQNGPQIRSRRKSVVFRSPIVTQRRTNFRHLVQHWRSLSTVQKNSWDTQSSSYPQVNSLGETYYLNGFQLFTKLNQVRLNQEIAILETAPSPLVFPSLSITNVIIDIDPIDIEIVFSPAAIPAFYEYRIWASNIISDGFVPAWPQAYKLIHSMTFGESSPKVIWPYWKAVFGPGPTNVSGIKVNWACFIAIELYNIPGNQSALGATNHGSIIQ